jgi:ribosomal protein L11
MDVKELKINVKITVNEDKLTSYLEQFKPDYEAGNLTYEEIMEIVEDNLRDFIDIEYQNIEA